MQKIPPNLPLQREELIRASISIAKKVICIFIIPLCKRGTKGDLPLKEFNYS
jgi:hypothetical protein